MSFIKELKRRNVIRVAIAYAVATWLLVEVSVTTFPMLRLPEWTATFVTVLLMIGFPVALIFAWAYELTPEGLKKEKHVVRSESITHLTGRKFNFAIIGLLVLALVFVIVDNYVLRDEPAPVALEQTEPTVQPLEKSIAVLPFINMSDDPGNEYFSDGISEEVLNLLAQVPGLRVIARTSSFSFKGQNVDIATIAERLNVTHVLEGSVRKSSNTVRITAQLVNASTSGHIWSETFDRTLEDIFDIQDEIAAEVVEQLKFTLLAPVPKSRNTDPETYRLYLQATHILNQLDWGKNAQAESLLRQALQLDPSFTTGWRELSRALWRQVGTGPSLKEDIRRAREALGTALEIEPNDAVSLAYSAWHVMDFDGDIVRAARLFERTFSIEPANEDVVRATLGFAMAFGRPEDVVAIGEYAIAHNPLCYSCNVNLARAYQRTGRLDEAEAAIRTIQSLFRRGDGILGLNLLLKGQPQAALKLLGEAHTPLALYDLGRLQESAVAFKAWLDASADERPWDVARAYAWMGKIDAAFEAIDKAAERDQLRVEGDIVRWNPLKISRAARHPLFHRLHDDPRWQEFLEKYGISAEQLADVQFKVTLPK